MPFIKGKPKTGGKKKGSQNTATRDIKEAYKLLIEGNLENMTAWLKRVAVDDPAKAISLLIQMSEYHIPKLARTEVTGKDGVDLIQHVTQIEVIHTQAVIGTGNENQPGAG